MMGALSVFDGINNPNNEEINYYYPTKALVTAPEILFFWVARMAMAGYEYVGKKPFDDVYLTGIVRDKQGRKMSKSLGNSPDPIELIEKYTADGVRVGMLLSSPAGNDLLFDEKLCEQGRNFGNKIWNAFRLTQGWEIIEMETPQENLDAIAWIKARISEALLEMNDHYGKYRMSDALMTTYKLIWDDFCSWYLESIKPEYQKPIDKKTFEATQDIFEDLLKIIRDIETQKEDFGKSLHKEAFTGVDYLGNLVKFSSYVIWTDNNKIYKYNFDENWIPFDNELLRRDREERLKELGI